MKKNIAPVSDDPPTTMAMISTGVAALIEVTVR